MNPQQAPLTPKMLEQMKQLGIEPPPLPRRGQMTKAQPPYLMAAKDMAVKESEPSQTGSLKSILIMQQEPKVAQLWEWVLHSQGHLPMVEPFKPDLSSLLLLVDQHRPDLILLDMGAGNFNPYAVCRECRTRFPEIKIVLTHAVGREIQAAEQRWAVYQGATHVVTTPHDPDSLTDCLQQIYQAAAWDGVVDPQSLMGAFAGLAGSEGSLSASPIVAKSEPASSGSLTPEVVKPPNSKPAVLYRGRRVHS